MSNPDFTTSADPETLANEVACLKATVTLLLKAIGQAASRCGESNLKYRAFYC